jgi:hypothetical protein
MNTSEENIQQQIEKGIPTSGIDVDAYQIVFNAIKKEPHLKLSAGFANKVALRVSPEKSFNWDKFLLIGGGIGFFLSLMYAILSVNATFSFGAFTFLSSYQGLLVFGIIFILGLNWLDKKLTHSNAHHA